MDSQKLLCGGYLPVFITKNIMWQRFSLRHYTADIIMSQYIFFNEDYSVLICKTHQHAIPSKYITRHFLEEHGLSFSLRQIIQTYASQYTVKEAAELTYHSERIQPIPYLKIVDGFQCQYESCNKIHITVDSMKRHCRATHDWKAKDGERGFKRERKHSIRALANGMTLGI